jgi:hypothetical protein
MLQIVEQRPSTAVEQGLLVVTEPVKKIKHRILVLRLFPHRPVIVRGEINAIVDYILENFAVEDIAIDPALSVRRLVRERHARKNQNEKTSPEDAKHEIQSTRSVALVPDRA